MSCSLEIEVKGTMLNRQKRGFLTGPEAHMDLYVDRSPNEGGVAHEMPFNSKAAYKVELDAGEHQFWFIENDLLKKTCGLGVKTALGIVLGGLAGGIDGAIDGVTKVMQNSGPLKKQVDIKDNYLHIVIPDNETIRVRATVKKKGRIVIEEIK